MEMGQYGGFYMVQRKLTHHGPIPGSLSSNSMVFDQGKIDKIVPAHFFLLLGPGLRDRNS